MNTLHQLSGGAGRSRASITSLRLGLALEPERHASQPTSPLLVVPASCPYRSRAGRIAKRALDIGLSLSLLVALSPLLAILGLLIRFESDGPVFFRQQRLGLHGKPFTIFKFRTMSVLEDGEDVRQVEPGDSRVTRLGRFLRASSIDELPQFINVIRGEMSLVGPRPHAVAHDRHFGSRIGGYSLRRTVKPGITGWAQINGLRGATPTLECMRARVDYDLWYARHAGFLLDLKILVRTPIELLRRRNAY